MMWLLPPLPPTFDAALRDVRAQGWEARVAAAERLGRASPEERERALPGLLTLAEDRDARVRAETLASLRQLADPSVLPTVRARVDDSDPRVRELAVVALGALRG